MIVSFKKGYGLRGVTLAGEGGQFNHPKLLQLTKLDCQSAESLRVPNIRVSNQLAKLNKLPPSKNNYFATSLYGLQYFWTVLPNYDKKL